MKKIKVGDKVQTQSGYQGVVKKIYEDNRVILDIGCGQILGCCLDTLKKVKEK